MDYQLNTQQVLLRKLYLLWSVARYSDAMRSGDWPHTSRLAASLLVVRACLT